MTKYLLIAVIVLMAVCGVLVDSLVKSQAECERLAGNNRALLDDVQCYSNRLGESVASVERLQLTKKELEQNYAAVCEETRQLDIKVKRLQSAAVAAVKTELKAEAAIKAGIVLRDVEKGYALTSQATDENAEKDTVQMFEYRDPPWMSVEGVIDSGKVKLEILAIDTLVQIVHRVPKRFLCFRFGTKAIRQEIVSKNPYTKVVYTEYIELVK